MIVPLINKNLEADFIQWNDDVGLFEFWLKKVDVTDETEAVPVIRTCWRFKVSFMRITLAQISLWVD